MKSTLVSLFFTNNFISVYKVPIKFKQFSTLNTKRQVEKRSGVQVLSNTVIIDWSEFQGFT